MKTDFCHEIVTSRNTMSVSHFGHVGMSDFQELKFFKKLSILEKLVYVFKMILFVFISCRNKSDIFI